MPQTIALQPTTAAAESSDIVVADGPVSVTVYGGQAAARIERKIDGAWYPAGQDLKISTPNGMAATVCIAGPGTYRVSKLASDDAVGVAVDS